MREPTVAGRFYPAAFEDLDKELKDCFYGERGPGELPISRDNTRRIRAIIVPHAGYQFSGACAAWAYKEIAERHFPKTYILLGFSHQGLDSGISIEDWRTPFGMIKTDKDLAIHLKETTGLRIEEKVHADEHSIEVQLPFLQFVNRDVSKDQKILPISINHDVDFRSLGTALHEALRGRDVVFIVSSDFTHYGRSYGYLPFTTDIEKRLNDLDKSAIDLIMSLDVKGFSELLNKTQVTICGFYPILLLMHMLSLDEEKPKGRLLMHYTSGDIVGDHSNSVSYASILF